MRAIVNFFDRLPVFWVFLSLPAVLFIYAFASGATIAMDLLYPTGELSARFMIVALAISPLITIFGRKGWLRWLERRRRSFGLAAFGYALLHLVFYLIDMEEMQAILAEIGAPGIWTGWLAFALLIPLAITSNDKSMRKLKSAWKRLQRIAYPAAILTLAHWLLIHDGVRTALLHFIPLLALQLLRSILIYTRRRSTLSPKENKI